MLQKKKKSKQKLREGRKDESAPGSEGHTLPLGRWAAAYTPVLSPSKAFLGLMIKGLD